MVQTTPLRSEKTESRFRFDFTRPRLRTRWRQYVGAIGPGLVTGASDDDRVGGLADLVQRHGGDNNVAEIKGFAFLAVAAFEFVKARLTGAAPNLGESRKVTVDLR